MQVAKGVGAQEEVPDDLPEPGLGVDQVAGASGAEGRELRQVASMVLWRRALLDEGQQGGGDELAHGREVARGGHGQ